MKNLNKIIHMLRYSQPNMAGCILLYELNIEISVFSCFNVNPMILY